MQSLCLLIFTVTQDLWSQQLGVEMTDAVTSHIFTGH